MEKRERIFLLNEEQIKARNKVFEYLQEESEDYYQACANGEDSSNHIWLAVRVLMDCEEI